MKTAVFGLDYAGLSNAVLLAQHNELVSVGITLAEGDMLNARKSPIVDAKLEAFIANRALDLIAIFDLKMGPTT